MKQLNAILDEGEEGEVEHINGSHQPSPTTIDMPTVIGNTYDSYYTLILMRDGMSLLES